MAAAEGELKTSGVAEQLPDPAAMARAVETAVYRYHKGELHFMNQVLHQLAMT